MPFRGDVILSSTEVVIALKEAGWAVAIGLACLLFYFLKNPSKVAQWASMITGILEKISNRAARHGAAVEIQGKIAEFVKSAHMGILMPYGLKIKWITKSGDESYVDKSDVVVVMAYRRNSDRNFIAAVRHYTSKALLPNIRHDLSRELISAAELVVQEKLIRLQRPDALGIFTDEVVPSTIRGDAETRRLHESLRRLDRLGFFANILLNEIALYAEALLDMDAASRAHEVNKLAKFLENFWDRMSGEDVPLEYNGKVFKVDIILVARLKTKVAWGAAAYLSRAERALSRGFRSIYVTGRAGDEGFLERVIKELKSSMPEKFMWMRKYRSRQQSASYDATIAFFRR